MEEMINNFTFNSTMALAMITFSFSIKINKEIGVHKKNIYKDKWTINKSKNTQQLLVIWNEKLIIPCVWCLQVMKSAN